MAEQKKRKFLNPPQISCEVVDLDGKTTELTARRITPENAGELLQMEEDVAALPAMVQIRKQAAYIFGGDEKDYLNYDLRVIKGAVTYFYEEMQNPL